MSTTTDIEKAPADLFDAGLCDVVEAVEYLGISRSSVYEQMYSGRLPYCKIGRSRRIPRNALRAFAAASMVDATEHGNTEDR